MHIRQRKPNSDLYGVQIFKNSKNWAHKNGQHNKRKPYKTLEQADEKRKPIHDGQNVVKSDKCINYQKINTQNCIGYNIIGAKYDSPQKLIDGTLKLIHQFYKTQQKNIQSNKTINQQNQYYKTMKKFLKTQFDQHKRSFIEHINKLVYLCQQMNKRNFEQNQLQIIQQWRINPLLYSLRAYWYQYLSAKLSQELRKGQNKNVVNKFAQQYETFKNLIAQIAYLYFGNFFTQSKNKQKKVLTKFTQQTSHYIITHTQTWHKIYNKLITPLIKHIKTSLIVENIHVSENYDISKFRLQDLELSIDPNLVPFIQLQQAESTDTEDINYKQQRKMRLKNIKTKTEEQIKRFIEQTKLCDKIKHLKKIRQVMQQQILNIQLKLVANKTLRQVKVLDKDDFIDYLVYNLVNLISNQSKQHRTDKILEKLLMGVKYVHVLLGQNAHQLLSKLKCEAYLTDLQVALTYVVDRLNQSNIKGKELTKNATEQYKMESNQQIMEGESGQLYGLIKMKSGKQICIQATG